MGHSRFVAAAAVLLGSSLAVVPVTGQEPGFSVPVHVAERDGVGRGASPVRIGVPLPRNVASDPTAFRLLAPDGSEMPFDSWAIERWYGAPDEAAQPIRWLGISFLAPSAAHQEQVFSLVAAAPDAVAAPTLGELRADGIYLDNGAIALRIPHAGTSLVDDVWIDLDGRAGVEAEMIAADHEGGLLIANASGTAPRWQARGAHFVHNGQVTAMARVDLASTTAEFGDATLFVEVVRGSPVVKLSLSIAAPDTDAGDSIVSLVLPVQTLGDPLELGVRRGLTAPTLEGPLPANSTLRVERTASGWDGLLGTVRATGLVPWAQLNTLTWSTAIAVSDDSPAQQLRVGGNGAFWIDLQTQPGDSRTSADVFFESRRRTAPANDIADRAAPLTATLPAAAYLNAETFGPAAVAGAAMAGQVSAEDRDAALQQLIFFMNSGDPGHLALARDAVAAQLASPATSGLQGPALYARMTADATTHAEVGRLAQAANSVPSPGWQALNSMTAWEMSGDPRLLDQARAILRAGIGTAWAADACTSANSDAASIAVLMRATAQYIWMLRSQRLVDQAAENALFGMLGRIETCAPVDPRWTQTWAFGAFLAGDEAQRARWAALATGAPDQPRRAQ
jgi:hypothetical protein